MRTKDRGITSLNLYKTFALRVIRTIDWRLNVLPGIWVMNLSDIISFWIQRTTCWVQIKHPVAVILVQHLVDIYWGRCKKNRIGANWKKQCRFANTVRTLAPNFKFRMDVAQKEDYWKSKCQIWLLARYELYKFQLGLAHYSNVTANKLLNSQPKCKKFGIWDISKTQALKRPFLQLSLLNVDANSLSECICESEQLDGLLFTLPVFSTIPVQFWAQSTNGPWSFSCLEKKMYNAQFHLHPDRYVSVRIFVSIFSQKSMKVILASIPEASVF